MRNIIWYLLQIFASYSGIIQKSSTNSMRKATKANVVYYIQAWMCSVELVLGAAIHE